MISIWWTKMTLLWRSSEKNLWYWLNAGKKNGQISYGGNILKCSRNKYTYSQGKVPTILNIVKRFTNSTHPPNSKVQTVQEPIQKNIPVVRIHASRVAELKAGDVNLGTHTVSWSPTPPKTLLGSRCPRLYTDLKSGDEKVVQLHIDSERHLTKP